MTSDLSCGHSLNGIVIVSSMTPAIPTLAVVLMLSTRYAYTAYGRIVGSWYTCWWNPMYKWSITVPVQHRLMPDTIYAVYNSLMTDAGFTLRPFDRTFSAGMVLVTHIEFTVSHSSPRAMTLFMLRWPRMEFTVSEL